MTQLPIHVTMAPRRAGDPAKLVADNSKAKEILGWHPQYTDIKQIIQTAWNFHLKIASKLKYTSKLVTLEVFILKYTNEFKIE